MNPNFQICVKIVTFDWFLVDYYFFWLVDFHFIAQASFLT